MQTSAISGSSAFGSGRGYKPFIKTEMSIGKVLKSPVSKSIGKKLYPVSDLHRVVEENSK
jgi:hypothetical protein